MFKKLLITSALLVTFGNVYAQTSQNFSISGTVAPIACTVALGSSAFTLAATTFTTVKTYAVLNALAYTAPALSTSISVNCGGAVKVALAFSDIQSGKSMAIDANDVSRFGLVNGSSGTTSIGSYQVAFTSTTLDTPAVSAQFVNATNNTTGWLTTVPAGMTVANSTAMPGRSMSFFKTASLNAPEAFTTLAGSLTFTTYLSKAVIDAATTAVLPNGSGTLTLVYL